MKDESRITTRDAVIGALTLLVCIAAALALYSSFMLAREVKSDPAIKFDGRTIVIDPSQTYEVQSVQSTTTYTTGTVITTSAVTVTIWRKP